MTDNDIDILSIDNKIQNNFNEELKQLPLYINHLNDLLKTESNLTSDKIKNIIKKDINKLKYDIDRIKSGHEKNFYNVETMQLLEDYKEILKTPLKVNFLGKPKINNYKKNEIIEQYISIAQKYYLINTKQKELKLKVVCDNCSNKKDFIVEENAYICPVCFVQQDIIQYSASYKDSDRVNISTKYSYDRRVHFRDCINQYQGKQNCTIHPDVYDKLDDIFVRHHLIVPDKTLRLQHLPQLIENVVRPELPSRKSFRHSAMYNQCDLQDVQ